MNSNRSTLQIQRDLNSLAADQLGLFTRDEASRLGILDASIQERLAASLIQRCHTGVYRLVGVEGSFEQQCLGACLAVRDSVLSGRSAAFLHGLPIGPPPKLPELTVPHSQRFFGDGIVVRRTRHPLVWQPWQSGRIATVGSTLISIAPLVAPTTLTRCIDHALAHRLISVPRLMADVERRPSQRFRGRAQLLADLESRVNGRPLHRSGLEQRVNRWLTRSGLIGSTPNFVVRTPLGDVEVDFAWVRCAVGLEVSPFFTHGSAEAQQNDARRRRALATARWRTVEATDDHLVSFESFHPVAKALRLLIP